MNLPPITLDRVYNVLTTTSLHNLPLLKIAIIVGAVILFCAVVYQIYLLLKTLPASGTAANPTNDALDPEIPTKEERSEEEVKQAVSLPVDEECYLEEPSLNEQIELFLDVTNTPSIHTFYNIDKATRNREKIGCIIFVPELQPDEEVSYGASLPKKSKKKIIVIFQDNNDLQFFIDVIKKTNKFTENDIDFSCLDGLYNRKDKWPKPKLQRYEDITYDVKKAIVTVEIQINHVSGNSSPEQDNNILEVEDTVIHDTIVPEKATPTTPTDFEMALNSIKNPDSKQSKEDEKSSSIIYAKQ